MACLHHEGDDSTIVALDVGILHIVGDEAHCAIGQRAAMDIVVSYAVGLADAHNLQSFGQAKVELQSGVGLAVAEFHVDAASLARSEVEVVDIHIVFGVHFPFAHHFCGAAAENEVDDHGDVRHVDDAVGGAVGCVEIEVLRVVAENVVDDGGDVGHVHQVVGIGIAHDVALRDFKLVPLHRAQVVCRGGSEFHFLLLHASPHIVAQQRHGGRFGGDSCESGHASHCLGTNVGHL